MGLHLFFALYAIVRRQDFWANLERDRMGCLVSRYLPGLLGIRDKFASGSRSTGPRNSLLGAIEAHYRVADPDRITDCSHNTDEGRTMYGDEFIGL